MANMGGGFELTTGADPTLLRNVVEENFGWGMFLDAFVRATVVENTVVMNQDGQICVPEKHNQNLAKLEGNRVQKAVKKSHEAGELEAVVANHQSRGETV
jgi:hypothetical protein